MDPVNFRARDPSCIKEDVRYAIQIAESYKMWIEGVGSTLEGKKLLDLGPGINFGPSLILASYVNTKISVADRFLSEWQEGYHPAFYAALLNEWRGPNYALRRTVEEQSYDNTLHLIREPAEALSQVPDNHFDIVVSNAVLEHVYDFKAVAKEMARVTRAGGQNFHQIDYRDHKNFDAPLEFLLEDSDTYTKEFPYNTGERGNRVRPCEAVAIFESSGFLVYANQINMSAENYYFDTFLPRLRSSNSIFSKWPEEDLRSVGGLLIVTAQEDEAVRINAIQRLLQFSNLKE